jgi:hypothetical protein
MTTPPEKICGDCARFKVPDAGCPNFSDLKEHVEGLPLMDAKSAACSDFFPASKARKEKPKKKQLKDSGIVAEGCFEAIYLNEKPCFLTKNGENFTIVESIEVNGETFSAKEAKHFPYEPYCYFEGTVPNREELFWKVNHEFQTFVDIESIWKDVLSACVLLSYRQEKLQAVPYLFLYGDNESGKSTVLQVLKFLCYRPMYGVTVPSADIYGFLEDSDAIGCILEDEVQGIYKDTDKIKIYKAGYKQGAVVPRTIMTQHNRIIKYYHTFCFKACASEQIPQVKGFNERFLFIPMVEGSPEKEWVDITKEDLDSLRNLRNMLLKWRMLSRDCELPEIKLNMKGRLKELWKPILQMAHGLTVYETLFKFAENQKKERLGVKQDTLEGKIVKVVVDIHNETTELLDGIPFQRIWSDLRIDLDGKIDERKPHVMDTSEFFDVTKNKVGYRLREILSGKPKVLREKDAHGDWVSTRAYEFDIGKLRRVAKKYGYELVTKLPSLSSSKGMQTPEGMEKSHENNVKKGVDAPLELGKVSNSVTKTPETKVATQQTTCNECLNFQRASCVHPNPQMIFPTAVYPTTCEAFLKKEQQNNDPN